jgi:hypothetical protein
MIVNYDSMGTWDEAVMAYFRILSLREIWSSHRGEDGNVVLLDCDAVYTPT